MPVEFVKKKSAGEQALKEFREAVKRGASLLDQVRLWNRVPEKFRDEKDSWRDLYYSILQVPKGSSSLKVFIDLRADEFKLEMRLLREKYTPEPIKTYLRRERLNPDLRDINILI